MRKREAVTKLLEEHFDAIFNAIHDDLLISDGEGVVLRVSPAFEERYGVDRSA